MSQKLDASPAAIGIDIGKNSFHIVGQNQRGAIVLRQKWSRGQVEARLANLPPRLIGMEACAELPGILATPSDTLSPRMQRVIEALASDLRFVDDRIEGLSSEIEELAKRDAGCQRLISIPGIGPIISSAMVAAIGTGDAFTKGRDFAAWLGLGSKSRLAIAPSWVRYPSAVGPVGANQEAVRVIALRRRVGGSVRRQSGGAGY